ITIEGKLFKERDKSAIKEVEVTLAHNDKAVADPAKTGKDGKFSIKFDVSQLNSGPYQYSIVFKRDDDDYLPCRTDVKFTVVAADLQVIDVAAVDKIYDATIKATVDLGNAKLSAGVPIKPGTLEISDPAAEFGDKNVGNNKDVRVVNLALSGSGAKNYN